MKTAVALTLIIMGALLSATPLLLSYIATTHGSRFDVETFAGVSCQLIGIAMLVVGIVFSFISLRSRDDSTKNN